MRNAIRMDGIVIAAYSTTEYEVKLDNNLMVKARVSGKIRVHHIRILPGDRVTVELSPYDLTRGRITYRQR